ncbi:MAG: tRNA (adenosine(37)-N6)-threonylcarbamoyltransferase complex ATPase subunit type 1 TsaE [Bacilli bacterium]
MKIEKIITNEQKMIDVGQIIGEMAKPNMVIALNGDLGAGKTTLTKGIGLGLGIKKTINSPTFTIMKIYQGRLPLYHLDVYRINENSKDDDLEEYFERDGLCVVEWADNIAYLLPHDLLTIDIIILEDGKRQITLRSENNDFIQMLEAIK